MKKISWILLIVLGLWVNVVSAERPDDIITTAERYVQHKKELGYYEGFIAPHSVIICYQKSTLNHLLERFTDIEVSRASPYLYVTKDNKIGILAGMGIGAPALAAQVEQLAVLGVKRFVGVGTAGALLNKFEIGEFAIASKALGEDGIAHLYLNGPNFVEGNTRLNKEWNDFAPDLNFQETVAWSYSAIFRERTSDLLRVTKLGCGVVEMETATLFAIAQERGLEALALYVISDVINPGVWVPHLKDPNVIAKTNLMADRVFQFLMLEK